MANKEIGNRLRELRNERGLTQQNVADMLGLKNKSTLGNWEIGNSEPDAVTFLKLCSIYGIEDILNSFGYSTSEINLTYHEQVHIKKYRILDERGKANVDNLLETEYQYILNKQKEEYQPRVIAAHHEGEWTEADDLDVERVKELARRKAEKNRTK